MMTQKRKKYFFLGFVVLTIGIPWIVPSSYFLAMGINIGIFSLLALGVVLLWGHTGLLTLGQGAFFGIGAYSAGIFTLKMGWPPLASLGIGIVITLAISFLVGMSVLRLERFYFAVATLGFNYVACTIFDGWVVLTGGSLGLLGIPNFALGSFTFDNDLKCYYLVLVILYGLYWFCFQLSRSRTGRALKAIREDQSAAGMLGISPFAYKMKIFLFVAGLAGFSGGLQAHYLQICTPRMFDITISFEVVNMAIVGGYHRIIGSFVGTAILAGIAESVRGLGGFQLLLYGFIFLTMLIYLPQGIVGWVQDKVGPFLFQKGKVPEKLVVSFSLPKPTILATPKETKQSPLLQIRKVSKAFGGLRVLHEVSFSLFPGIIKALIGPNGAGKTTLFNLISGFIHPDLGNILFKGKEISQLPPHKISLMGMGRTFQITRVFKNLSLKENVMVGSHQRGTTNFFMDGLSLPGTCKKDRAVEEWSLQCLHLVGLSPQANLLAGDLPLGQQKLLEIARALAAGPEILLLDEPAAGLNDVEVKKLMEALLYINSLGLPILLVEHKMEMVMNLAQEIVVINFGEKISEGTPDQVRHDSKVLTVYLGEES
jgi:branched-chain amino acid transport system permease protein